MGYCKIGDRVRVTYRFNDGSDKNFESEVAPIDIQIKKGSQDSTDNYSREGYELTFYSTNNRSWFSERAIDYKIIDQGGDLRFRYIIYVRFCGQKNFDFNVNIDPNTISIDSSKKCPIPETDNICILNISYNGKQIFSDTGECPITFNVGCNDGCPPRHIRCETSAYPGYCCIPCNEIKSEIAAMRSTIRRISNG
jgi:HSP20 family molecular chaperone IbpA